MSIEDRISEHLLEIEGPLNTPCWKWQRSTCNYGHGHIWFDGRVHIVHRLVYALCVGDIPDDMNVLHKCDVPGCCNPDHLFLGTQQDNIADMIAKGRHRFANSGEKNGRALVTAKDVLRIRKLCDEGTSHTELAREYGLQPSAIDKIAARRTWRHL